MNNHGLLTCLLPEECIQITIDKNLEGEYLWRHGEEVLLQVEKKQELWLHPGYLKITSQPLQTDTLYRGVTSKNEQFFLFFEWMELDTCTYQSYDFPPLDKIQIGRGLCDIQYDNTYVSNIHAQIVRKDQELWILDMDSRNGVYVNHKRCRKQQLYLGDCIYIMGLQIIIGNACFAINHPNKKVTLKNCSLYQKPLYENESVHLPMFIYPFHGQRVEFEFPSIHIQNPPTTNQREKMPFLYTLGPSMTMGIAALTSAFFSIQQAMQNQQSLASILPSLTMSFSMIASTLLWPILLRRFEQRRDVKIEEKRKGDYRSYLQKNQKRITQVLLQFKAYLKTQYDVDIESFVFHKHALYQFQMLSKEQMNLCIGEGNMEIQYPFQDQEQDLLFIEDEVLQAKEHFIKKTRTLEDVPICINLFKQSLWYITGNERHCIAYAIYLIVQLCAMYIPSQIQLVFAYEDEELPLQYLRYLPHIFDDKQRRYLCHNTQQAQQVSMYIHQRDCPCVIFSFSKRLSEAMHVLQLCELDHVSAFLFHKTEAHISFPHKSLRVLEKEVVDDTGKKFRWCAIRDVCGVIEVLSNINIPSFTEMNFPTMCSFLEMFKVQSIEQLHIYTRWLQNDSSRSLAIPLGVTAANEPVLLDIHEKAHGPHGIIAGMTGSGKSELLITMILSMAVNFHPDDVSFILIDYKGGGMAKALERIPHIAGVITNLDGNMIQRSLNSLDSELLRRQKIFIEKAKQLQMPSIDIYAYQRLYHQHLVEEALPHLLIVADEFAELKQQQPEFMEQLIRSARIGRSLGIHLLLATQKPSGVVDDQIWSNARFHICLKVQEKADSMDMLKRDDGAKLNDTGRFYLQVGYNELFEEGQSAYAKMAYSPNQNVKKEGAFLTQIDTLGNLIAKGKKAVPSKRYLSELEMILLALEQVAQVHHVHHHPIWMEPLASHIPLKKENKGMIAMVDDPIKQRQFPLCISLASFVHTLLFAMNLQASINLLKAYFYQLCHDTSIDDLRILFFDFAAVKFVESQEIPHVYAYVQGESEDDIRFLRSYIEQELQERKVHKKQQRLLICIHHLIAFLELNEEWDNLLYLLARDGEQYGISLLFTATSANDVRYRLLQQFSFLISFPLRDESEYSTLFGSALHPLHQKDRAYWKGESIYEIQCVDASEVLQEFIESEKGKGCARMIHLPAHISLQQMLPFYDDKNPSSKPIGICKDMRTPYFIDFNYVWIVSGSERLPFQATLSSCDFTKDVSFDIITKFEEDEMTRIIQQKQYRFYWISSNMLSEFRCASWLQKHQKEVRILWLGAGIESIRYVFDIPMKYPDLYAQDAYVITDEIHQIRVMEEL